MSFEIIFVTVGTTEFDKLIDTFTNERTVQALKKIGCKHVKMQIGSGHIIPRNGDIDFTIEYYRFKDSIADDILQADLIIGHAGAGTSLDVLEKRKPLITVINDDLMNNHQIELAEKLHEQGYSVCCTCDTLPSAIESIDKKLFKPFHFKNYEKCARYIENVLFTSKMS